MASTSNRPIPHRNLSRLQVSASVSPMLDQRGLPIGMDGQPLFLPQSPVTAFHLGPMPLNAGNGPQSAAQLQFPQNVNPGMMGHRSRQSMAFPMPAPMGFNPANIPIPPTPGSMQFANGFVPNAPGNMPLPSPHLRGPGMHSRRTQSVSLGGPPKAVLGGPKRVLPVEATSISPAPLATSTPPIPTNPAQISVPIATPTPTAPPATSDFKVNGKMKKCIVKLPKESVDASSDVATPPAWARHPIRLSESHTQNDEYNVLADLDVSTGDIFHISEDWVPTGDSKRRQHIPAVEVFLPVKVHTLIESSTLEVTMAIRDPTH